MTIHRDNPNLSGLRSPAHGKDDVRALDGMTPFQELCNAATMCAPLVICFLRWLFPPAPDFWTFGSSLISCGIFVHLPFSINYHLCLAKRTLPHAIDNTPRRLDQTFIHVACCFMTFALSDSTLYALACTAVNLYFISRLWAKRDAGLVERMVNIGVGVAQYIMGCLLRGDYWNFFFIGLYFLLAGGAMFWNFQGWGHSVFHILLGGMAYHALDSTSRMS
eukprot:TRINITY_DN77603_c0_g1_i1.p1 TRINITY_DN77603_c0_g1~~TRINITY_DN77603_c0_g1_i1.p1  ORF type:complete len:220 (-),score=22.72 TRINITY_DN77603_c0_g1_i1:39-698(-)